MQSIAGIFIAIGSVVWWFVQKFLPFLIKKYGLGAVRFAIQKSISVLVVLVTVSFYFAVIVFISESYTQFRIIAAYFQDPAALSSKVGVSSGLGNWECFIYLFNTSGMAAGFNSAIHFGITVFIFFFFRSLYKITQKTTVIISAELSRLMRASY